MTGAPDAEEGNNEGLRNSNEDQAEGRRINPPQMEELRMGRSLTKEMAMEKRYTNEELVVQAAKGRARTTGGGGGFDARRTIAVNTLLEENADSTGGLQARYKVTGTLYNDLQNKGIEQLTAIMREVVPGVKIHDEGVRFDTYSLDMKTGKPKRDCGEMVVVLFRIEGDYDLFNSTIGSIHKTSDQACVEAYELNQFNMQIKLRNAMRAPPIKDLEAVAGITGYMLVKGARADGEEAKVLLLRYDDSKVEAGGATAEQILRSRASTLKVGNRSYPVQD